MCGSVLQRSVICSLTCPKSTLRTRHSRLPTLFLSECVLIYLSATHSDAIIEWVAQHFATCSFVSYEQINPHDAFGKVMVKNMQARGLTLQGIETYPTIDSLRARYTAAGWQAVVVADMKEAYDKVLPEPERKRYLLRGPAWCGVVVSLSRGHPVAWVLASELHPWSFWMKWSS